VCTWRCTTADDVANICVTVLCIAVFAGLAIDVGRRKLYYSVDEGSANAGEVGELSTDGTDRKVLNHQNRSVPQSVVIDIDNR